MDPDAALDRLRKDSARATNGRDTDRLSQELDYLRDMQAAFEELDEWLTKGGHPPDEWENARKGGR